MFGSLKSIGQTWVWWPSWLHFAQQAGQCPIQVSQF